MSGPGDEVVERARALVGTRFRLHGRGEDGVDCVGLAAVALGLGPGDVPSGYPLRGGDPAVVAGLLAARLRAVSGTWLAGDLLLMETGPAQLHLGIWTGGGLVHADLGLRRVVERPGVPPWPVLSGWRA